MTTTVVVKTNGENYRARVSQSTGLGPNDSFVTQKDGERSFTVSEGNPLTITEEMSSLGEAGFAAMDAEKKPTGTANATPDMKVNRGGMSDNDQQQAEGGRADRPPRDGGRT